MKYLLSFDASYLIHFEIGVSLVKLMRAIYCIIIYLSIGLDNKTGGLVTGVQIAVAPLLSLMHGGF